MTEKRLLVVGGTGFIGSHVCKKARNQGFSVHSFSQKGACNPIPGVKYRFGDITDLESTRRALSEQCYGYVINCSGYIDHRLFRNGGRNLIEAHFSGVQNLVMALDSSSLLRFVQLGSSDEYGLAPAPQRESYRESPISPYSLSKVATTHLLQMLWRTESFPATVLRLFLTYGPGQDQGRFIPQIVMGCLQEKKFALSEGRQIRDFCFIDDVVDGIMLSLELQAALGEVINLSSGTPVTIRSVVDEVQKIIGTGIPQYGQIPYRPGENMELYADTGKAKDILNWRPKISLNAGLRRTIDYYRG